MKKIVHEKIFRPIVWMFAGQGAQYFQMGHDLYKQNTVFRCWMNKLDAIAKDYVEQSIITMLYASRHSKKEVFNQILYTHPALFMVQYSMAQTLLSEGFSIPDYLLGASLGEFIAATLAHVVDVETMFINIIKQAYVFNEYCSGGAMLLVIDDVNTFYNNPIFTKLCTLNDKVELAGINFDRCFVISGLCNSIQKIATQLHKQEIAYQILPVSVAFHSSFMDCAYDSFCTTLGNKTCYAAMRIPILSCRINIPDIIVPFSTNYWWEIIRQPIQFKRVFSNFHKNHKKALYLDLSPMGSMATFAKHNLFKCEHHRVISIMTPLGHDINNMCIAHKKLQLATTNY